MLDDSFLISHFQEQAACKSVSVLGWEVEESANNNRHDGAFQFFEAGKDCLFEEVDGYQGVCSWREVHGVIPYNQTPEV